MGKTKRGYDNKGTFKNISNTNKSKHNLNHHIEKSYAEKVEDLNGIYYFINLVCSIYYILLLFFCNIFTR